jgi:hypothetical protein
VVPPPYYTVQILVPIPVHTFGVHIFSSSDNSSHLSLLDPSTFPQSPVMLRIIRRSFPFPVDISPCLVYRPSCHNNVHLTIALNISRLVHMNLSKTREAEREIRGDETGEQFGTSLPCVVVTPMA